MGKVKSQLAVSLDGYAAGPHQSVDDPLGVGAEGRLEQTRVIGAPGVVHLTYRVNP